MSCSPRNFCWCTSVLEIAKEIQVHVYHKSMRSAYFCDTHVPAFLNCYKSGNLFFPNLWKHALNLILVKHNTWTSTGISDNMRLDSDCVRGTCLMNAVLIQQDIGFSVSRQHFDIDILWHTDITSPLISFYFALCCGLTKKHSFVLIPQ